MCYVELDNQWHFEKATKLCNGLHKFWCFWWQLGCQCRFKMTSLFSLLLLPAKGNHSRWVETSYTWPGWRWQPLASLKMGKPYHLFTPQYSNIQHAYGLYKTLHKTDNNIVPSLNNVHIYKERCILQTSKSLSTAQRDIWGMLLRIQQGGHYQPTFTELSSCASLFNVWKLMLKQHSDRIVLSGLQSPPNLSDSRDVWANAQLRWHEVTVCL